MGGGAAFFLLSTVGPARGGPLTDAAEAVLEADVEAVRGRLHETIPGLPVRVFTLRVTEALKGSVPATVTLVLPGGTMPDGSGTVHISGAPSMDVGQHVLVFARARDLGEARVLAEADGLRLAGFGGIYRRVAGEPALAEDGWGRPLALELVDGATTLPEDRPLPVADDGKVVEEVPLPVAEWASVLSAVATEVATPGPSARAAIDQVSAGGAP